MNRAMSLRRLALACGIAAALGMAAATGSATAAGFSFGLGIGPGMYFGDEGEDYGGACLTDYLLRKSLGEAGYRDIFLNLENDHHMQVRATRGEWVYKLLVNSCSGKILSRERLRPAS